MRKRSRFVPLIVLVAAAGAAYWSADPFGQRAGPKAPPERPFVELEAVIAVYTRGGWEIATRPRLPGPYREGEVTPVSGAGVSMVSRVRDNTGAVTEELRVDGDSKFDQLVVRLDTASGGRTQVALRRPRKP